MTAAHIDPVSPSEHVSSTSRPPTSEELERLRSENQRLLTRALEAERQLAEGLVESEEAAESNRCLRTRMRTIRQRLRARLAARGEEIAGLRRMVVLGDASRRELEQQCSALREALWDARLLERNNERHLDRLERRLEAMRDALAAREDQRAG